MLSKKDKDVDCRSCGHCEIKEDSNNQLKNCSRCKLVAYCGRECQAFHWKNGHKANCIAVKDRKVSNTQTSVTPSIDSKKDVLVKVKCVICLEPIEAFDFCSMPCEHIFHRACISDLRSSSSSLVCPLCRKDLPPGPEQAYTEALGILYSILDVSVSDTDYLIPIVDEMIRLFTCAGEEGHGKAQLVLGELFSSDLPGVEKNHEMAAKWIFKAVEQGLAKAQLNISILFSIGQGVVQNNELAFYWCSKSAEQGYGPAQCKLGFLYEEGEGVVQNNELAVYWFTKSAEQGYGPAQCTLGGLYQHGLGVAQSYELSLDWYSKSAEQGIAEAQYRIGILYQHGKGVVQSYELAFQWFSKSAEQEHAEAQFNVGVICYDMKNTEEAKQWWLKAAKQGNVDAQNSLKKHYANYVL